MRVLVADQFSPAGLEEMKSAGIELVYNADLNGESLKAAIAEIKPQALVVRSTKVEKAHIDACSEL
jgi:D-3-phosphoglycerate dehydrogenase